MRDTPRTFPPILDLVQALLVIFILAGYNMVKKTNMVRMTSMVEVTWTIRAIR